MPQPEFPGLVPLRLSLSHAPHLCASMAFTYNARLHWSLAFVIMVMDIAIVAVTLYMDKVHHVEPPRGGETNKSAPIGWLGSFGAVAVFGCYGIFIKTPAVQEAKVDCMVFQVYYSLAVVITSMMIWLVAASSSGFYFTGSSFAMGLAFSSCWICLGAVAYNAVSIVGYAVAPAIWMGVTIVTSFVWGVCAFNNSVHSWFGSVAALVLMIGGVGLAASSSGVSDREQERAQREARQALAAELRTGESLPSQCSTKPTSGLMIFGIASACIAGAVNGSLMVFLNCFQHGCPAIGVSAYRGSVLAPLAFLPSLSLGILVAQPVIFLLYWGRSMLAGQMPEFHVKTTAIPGMLTGAFWGMGNFLSMYATVYLGQTIGFPLTQTCLVITGSWGIFYYKEIQGMKAIGTFVAAALLILAGAALDGMYA